MAPIFENWVITVYTNFYFILNQSSHKSDMIWSTLTCSKYESSPTMSNVRDSTWSATLIFFIHHTLGYRNLELEYDEI